MLFYSHSFKNTGKSCSVISRTRSLRSNQMIQMSKVNLMKSSRGHVLRVFESLSKLDRIAISLFVTTSVNFDKSWIWDKQACLFKALYNWQELIWVNETMIHLCPQTSLWVLVSQIEYTIRMHARIMLKQKFATHIFVRNVNNANQQFEHRDWERGKISNFLGGSNGPGCAPSCPILGSICLNSVKLSKNLSGTEEVFWIISSHF